MMRPRTVVNRILAADMANPFKPGATVLDVRYTDINTKLLRYLSSEGCGSTVDQMVARLFDMSLQGYFVQKVYTTTYRQLQEYSITLDLGFSKGMKSNLDGSVIEVIAKTFPFPFPSTFSPTLDIL